MLLVGGNGDDGDEEEDEGNIDWEFDFLGRKVQARLADEFGMRLAGIHDSSLLFCVGVTNNPLLSSRVTTNSSPAQIVPQSAAKRTFAPGDTYMFQVYD